MGGLGDPGLTPTPVRPRNNDAAKTLDKHRLAARVALASDATFAYAFSALLAGGAAVSLLAPLLRRAWTYSSGWKVLVILAGILVAMSLGTAYAVTTLSSDSPAFLPIVTVTAGLRIASPALMQRDIRNRFEASRLWPAVHVLVAIGFAILAGLLAYSLIRILVGETLPGFAMFSEQIIMAGSATSLIVRMAIRVRPRFSIDLWPIWMAAVLIAVAFIVVAPYAFPSFAVVYVAAGLVGWIGGLIILWRLGR